ncbi:hypothetical protein JJQ59_28415 [Cupriavidus necator]|uniref:hypothetical protein n=1 Tax=Cupriavidus necator TaxID=106590 RepID=UPI0011BD4AE8|nr:hypothetical protein [Cupriavidus necator]QQX86686.1 hypothetical protein JJQ59_28415 [Cupriavidus necator]
MLVATSISAIAPAGVVNNDVVSVLRQLSAQYPVGVFSNHAKPTWFDAHFAASAVQFIYQPGRQDGEVLKHNCGLLGVATHDCIVLAASIEDIAMGKNGGAVVVAAGWAAVPRVQTLGVRAATPPEFLEIVQLTAQWQGQWWFAGNGQAYVVRALADLSGYGANITQQQQAFGQRLTNVVKSGGAALNALLAVSARSLLIDGTGSIDGLFWGVYPSSASCNSDNEVLSDFAHRLRTTVSRVQMARRGQPLFLRHVPSVKRSGGGAFDRNDPTNQIETIHLNPAYSTGQLVGKSVVVLDDCTTYGVSFGVASAFLRAAGVANVLGLALGKFGNRLSYYDITINSNPFLPVANGNYVFRGRIPLGGVTNAAVQLQLHSLIP